MTRYDKGNVPPRDLFQDNEDLNRDHRSGADLKRRRYSIKKTWLWNWDDALEKLFKKIFRNKRR